MKKKDQSVFPFFKPNQSKCRSVNKVMNDLNKENFKLISSRSLVFNGASRWRCSASSGCSVGSGGEKVAKVKDFITNL